MVIGRTGEQEALARALSLARSGTTTASLIVGEAGIGKTTLLGEVEQKARTDGMTVVRTSSPEGSDQFRYAVVEDIGRALPDARERLTEAEAALLTGLSAAGSVGPSQVATALLHLLSEADADRPTVLLLDDLHWADSLSLAALTLAVGRLVHHPIAVIGTARPRPAIDPRLYAWERIDVGPLDWQSAIEVLRASVPAALSEDLTLHQADRVVSALGRHPLAIEECTRLLSPGQICGTEHLPDPIPLDDRLREAWGGTYRALPPATRRAVLALCVARGSGPDVLDRLLAENDLSRADLDAAVAARLVVPGAGSGGLPDVAHTLVAAAVVGSADSACVRRMHRTAARVAQGLGLAPAAVVAHLTAGGEPNDDQVIVDLCREAARAQEMGLGTVAGRALLEAARRSNDPAARAELGARAAQALLTRGRDASSAGPLVEFLDGLELSDEQRVWALWLRAEYLATQNLPRSLAALCAAADDAARCGSPALGSILWNATFVAWSVGDGGRAIGLARRFLELEQAGGQIGARLPAWAGRALLGLTLFQIGDVVRSETLVSQARAMSAQWTVDETTDLSTLVGVVVLDEALSSGLQTDDVRLQEALRRLAGDNGNQLAFMRNIQAARALRRADLATGRALVDEALSLSRAMLSTHNVVLRLCAAVRIDAIRGDTAALATEAGELRRLSRHLGHAWGLSFATRTQGLLALGEGRLDDALGYLEPLLHENLLLGLSPEHPVLLGRGDLVEALARSGSLDRAGQVLAGLESTLDGSEHPFGLGLLARSRGLLRSGSQAIAELEQGLDAFRIAGDTFEEARTQLLLGEQLRRERRTADARCALRAAYAEFDRMRARPWRDRACAELRATGAPVPGDESRAPVNAVLTAQELRVAQSVARGMSNRDAAAALFVSPRTIEHHLASAYRKLGIASRTALAACLADLDEDDRRAG